MSNNQAALTIEDAADLVEHTYYAFRSADEEERQAQAALHDAADSYFLGCINGGFVTMEAEDLLIALGDAAIELGRRQLAFCDCQQDMKRMWRVVPVRIGR